MRKMNTIFVQQIKNFTFAQYRFFRKKETMANFSAAIKQSDFELAIRKIKEGQQELGEIKKNKPLNVVIAQADFSSFSGQYNDEMISAVQQATKQVFSLLSNVTLCVELLKNLDSQIARYSDHHGLALEKIAPTEVIQFNDSFYLPLLPKDPIKLLPNIEYLHLGFMREQLKKYHIDVQPYFYQFLGFVDRRDASATIKKGALFLEELSLESFLIHGREVHYFQWYLIALALEKKLIQFDNQLSLRDFLIATVNFYHKGSGDMLWDVLLDHIIQNPPHVPYTEFYLGSPFRLNILLLLHPENRYLRGFMLNQWFLTIQNIQQMYFQKHKKEIPYECLVGWHAVSSRFADDYSLFTEKEFRFFAPSKKTQNLVPTKRKGVFITKDSESSAMSLGCFL